MGKPGATVNFRIFFFGIGVEKDAFEEDKAFGHVVEIWLSWDSIVD